MKEQTQKLLDKAARAVHAAKTLLDEGDVWLLDAFDKRIQGDYGVEAVITQEDVMQLIAQADEFLKEARRYLGIPS